MQAYMYLTLKPIELAQAENEVRKPNKLVSMFNKLMRRSVAYYTDSDLHKIGSPFIWTE